MSFSSIDLWHRISAAGLATPTECRSWAAEAVPSVDSPEATDGIKLLQRLIECKRLTKYQAKILAGQSDRSLRVGPWIILEPLKNPVWQDWYAVSNVDADANDPTKINWARWLTQNELQSLRGSAPGLQRGRRLAHIRHDRLQQVFLPEMASGRILLRVAPVEGELLGNAFAREFPSESRSRSVIRQIAEALSQLHRKDLVHGRILPDRVYLTHSGPVLAVDPLCTMTVGTGDSSAGVIQGQLSDLLPEQFLAPEFLAPGQTPTMASDIFALGCLWWWLLTGTPPATGDSAEQILRGQAGDLPELPAACALPQPLVLCLKHCLARNLSGRFASAVEFCVAFDAAQDMALSDKRDVSVSSNPTELSKPTDDAPVADALPAVSPIPSLAPKIEAVDSPPTTKVPTQPPEVSAAPTRRSVVPAAEAAGSTAQKQAASDKAATAGSASGGPPASPKKVEPPAYSASVPDSSTSKRQVSPREKPQTPKLPPGNVQPGKPASASSTPAMSRNLPRPTRRRRQNKWLVPLVAGCGFVIVLLIALKMSGALQPSATPGGEGEGVVAAYVPKQSGTPQAIPPDPRLTYYQIVASGGDQPWVPPRPPSAIPIDLLPPGGQLFVSFHPSEILASSQQRGLLEAFGGELNPMLEEVGLQIGVPLESVSQITAAFYSPTASGDFPLFCLRCELSEPQSLAALKTKWSEPSREEVGAQTLLSSSADRAYYIAQQPLVDVQTVQEFSVGPMELMREVCELHGAAGPLTIQMERLWSASDRDSDLSLLVATPYLLTEGRGLFNASPARFSQSIRELAGNEMRAGLLQVDFEPDWYFEVNLAGASDREAGKLKAALEGRIRGAPVAIEEWFVSQSPHPYWRALAFRFPQMLRTLNEYTRFGVEDGVAIMNAYMPQQASTNILLASWIAMQDGAVLEGELTANVDPTGSPTAQPLTVDQYLGRPIRLSFDQEPIEVALSLIGEEANDGLPAGTPQLRFALDGDAFEKAGITRNQQLSNFNVDLQPVRAALTEVAKRGNPVTTVTDTREEDQKLIWVLADDPESPGNQMVSLTTRAAATAAGIALPVEFASP